MYRYEYRQRAFLVNVKNVKEQYLTCCEHIVHIYCVYTFEFQISKYVLKETLATASMYAREHSSTFTVDMERSMLRSAQSKLCEKFRKKWREITWPKNHVTITGNFGYSNGGSWKDRHVLAVNSSPKRNLSL